MVLFHRITNFLFWGMCMGGILCSPFFSFANTPPILKPKLAYPLKIKPEISGSFAELRSTHFHGGMDFRTKQKEGLPVRSVADGFLFKISVRKNSYGKAIYIKHDNGLVSIYGHLSRFRPFLERMVKKAQKQSGQYEVTLDNLSIPIEKKERIARSGNTGSSFGPHLHFELRRSSPLVNSSNKTVSYKEYLLNPCLFGLRVEDRLPPLLLSLAIYPLDTLSKIQCPFFDTLSKVPVYIPISLLPDTIRLSGRIGFGLEALDTIENLPFHYGLYELAFMIDKDTLAYYRLDSISVENSSKINEHIDLPYYKLTKKRIEKSYVNSNALFSPYSTLKEEGSFTPIIDQKYLLRIVGRDFSGNTSSLSLILSTP